MLGNRKGNPLKEYVNSYVVFDLETTGTSPNNDDIIEISAVKVVNNEVVDTFSSLVNPMRSIPAHASMVNGITDDMVQNEPTIDEIMPSFIDFIEDYVLIGHNIRCFDMKFIWRDIEQIFGKTINNNYIDTLPMARKILPQLAHHTLGDVSRYFNISTEGAHRALNDCIMNQKCYEMLLKEKDKIKSTSDNPDNSSIYEKCPKCGKLMKIRNGIYGQFWGCTGFPDCRGTRKL